MPKLRVRLIAGSNLIAADSNGKSDPYCVISVPGDKHKSKVKKKTLEPQWDETFELKVQPTDKVKIAVYDKDTFSSDDSLGVGYAPLTGLKRGQEMVAWIPLTGGEFGENYQELIMNYAMSQVGSILGGGGGGKGGGIKNNGQIELALTALDFDGPPLGGAQPGSHTPATGMHHPPAGVGPAGAGGGQPGRMPWEDVQGGGAQGQGHPPPQGYGGQPPPQGYGGQPPPQGYGGQPPPQGYGAPGGYGQAPPQGYGAPGGYGQPPGGPQGYGQPQGYGYGAPPQGPYASGAYGTQGPPQGGYGGPPQGYPPQGGYGAPNPGYPSNPSYQSGYPPQGYGAPPQGYPPQGGYGAPPQGYPPQGGFGAPNPAYPPHGQGPYSSQQYGSYAPQ
eukprot:TRINITY_DN2671_c0_g1_i1.p1 TRINITY_DN2671_c0_g1~~TRINITY_DN2671_c0_g1_i1.p1  ORF type:complete len:395 (+),score=27.44 TRINITY_DN2671_c0_g1_i1:24-1187(+)